jgi:AcrR family transcriptional regulator
MAGRAFVAIKQDCKFWHLFAFSPRFVQKTFLKFYFYRVCEKYMSVKTALLPKIDTQGERRSSKPRKPRQQRSRERYEILLDSTESLLAEHDASDVGLYDIAKHAKVPPASVYHFFPTKEAAFVALADRYLEQLYVLTRNTAIDRKLIRQWTDIYVLGSERLVDFYNKHPVLLKLFFGSALSPEIRRRDMDYIKKMSEREHEWLNSYFIMPYIPDAELKFSVVLSIYDGVTLASYERHGCVTEEYRAELLRAVVAYCKTFLPEVIPLRQPESE